MQLPLFLLIASAIATTSIFAHSAKALAEDSGKTSEPQERTCKSPYLRMDFQVRASCVSCIRKVAKALKSLPGVTHADVSIYPPHWAVVVIETARTSETRVVARVRKEKADVLKIEKIELKDKPLFVFPKTETTAAPRL